MNSAVFHFYVIQDNCCKSVNWDKTQKNLPQIAVNTRNGLHDLILATGDIFFF